MDHTMSAHVDGDIFYCVLVEAKMIQGTDMSQLTDYHCLVSGGGTRNHMNVGLLVDEH